MFPTVLCSLLVDVLDPTVLHDYVRNRAALLKRTDIRPRHHGEAIVQAVVLISPGPSTEFLGFDLNRIETRAMPVWQPSPRCLLRPVESWRIGIHATVWDPERVAKYVDDRFRRCWGRAALLRQASFLDRPAWSVYEALVGSSEGPAIADLGLHLRSVDCRSYPSSAAA